MATGPGIITSLRWDIASPLDITAPHIESFGLANERSSYANAGGTTTFRGDVLKRITGQCWDWSAFATLEAGAALMTQDDLIITYISGDTQTLEGCGLIVTPITNIVTDVTRVVVGTSSAALTTLAAAGTGWTDVGFTLDTPQPAYDWVFRGQKGPYPYVSGCRVVCDVMLPAASYASVSAAAGTSRKVAFERPDGKYLVFQNVDVTCYNGDEDGNRPLFTHLHFEGVTALFSAQIAFHDGASATFTPADHQTGCAFEFVGFGLSEPSTFA